MNPTELNTDFWRRCSSCKTPIKYLAAYFVCSVSTCNRKRIGYVFDSVHCWERHLPGARHRDAAAVEMKSPTYAQWKEELESDGAPAPAPAAPTTTTTASADARTPQRVIARPANTGPAAKPTFDPLESEILVVVSKLKEYIRRRSEMNTSDSVSQALSNRIRRLCDKAIESARGEGRKTVMDRDFENF